MSMKKIISLVLTLAMLLPMGMSAFAEAYKMPAAPVSEEKITISYIAPMHAMQTNLTDYPYLADLEEATNVHLDATWVPNGQWAEKKNSTLAAGVDMLPDIFHALSAADVATYAPQGYFVALDEYISEELTPNLMDLFARYPDYKAAITASDGHIYTLPSINMLPFRQSPYNMFINKTWLDNLELEIPTTYEELYNVLCAFRDNDCNQNGDVGDEIPFAGNYAGGTDYFRWTSLFAMFGFPVSPNRQNLMYVTDDHRVTLAPLEEGFDEALRYFKKLYAERLMMTETFTQDNAAYTGMGAQQPAVYGVYFDWFGNVVVGADNFADYVVLPPLAGPDGNVTWCNMGTSLFYGGGGTAVTVNASNVEACIKWLDYLYMPEISLQTTRGNFGVVIEKNEEDGRYHYLNSEDAFRVANVPAEAIPFAFMADQVPSVVLAENMERKINEYYPINAAVMSQTYLPALAFTMEESAELSILNVDIESYVKKSVPEFITGQLDIDKDYDAFVKRLRKMQVDTYLGIYQAAYDRFQAAMK